MPWQSGPRAREKPVNESRDHLRQLNQVSHDVVVIVLHGDLFRKAHLVLSQARSKFWNVRDWKMTLL